MWTCWFRIQLPSNKITGPLHDHKSLFPSEFLSHRAQIQITCLPEHIRRKHLRNLRKEPNVTFCVNSSGKASPFKGHHDILILASCFHLAGTIFSICIPGSDS